MSRRKLIGLQNAVTYYNKLKDLDVKLDHLHFMWILYCGKTDEELLVDPLSQLAVDTMLEQSGNIIDRAEELFVKIKVQYPNKKEVIDYLDFVDKPVKNNQRG